MIDLSLPGKIVKLKLLFVSSQHPRMQRIPKSIERGVVIFSTEPHEMCGEL